MTGSSDSEFPSIEPGATCSCSPHRASTDQRLVGVSRIIIMWRLLRPRATRSSLHSPPVARLVPGRQMVVMQRVKLTRRFRLRWDILLDSRPRTPLPSRALGANLPVSRNVLLGSGAFLLCYHLYATNVLVPLSHWIDKEMSGMSAAELEELAKTQEPLFLAFPLTVKTVPAEPYRGSDPEWQAFIKISKDKDLQMKIRSMSWGLIIR